MSDIVTSRIFTDGEKGITAAKLNDIVGSSVVQPDFVASKPLASTVNPADNLLLLTAEGTYAKAPFSTITSSAAAQIPLADATQNGLLRQVSGLTTDVVDGTNHCVPIAGMSGITQMRLRSFNAIGNPTFEIDQRNVGNVLANPASGTLVQDRWAYGHVGTNACSVGANAQNILLPGTSFLITRTVFRVTLTTAQASLGAGDYINIYQNVEGINWRELSNDVHSVSLLVRSSVAGLKFGVNIRDPGATSKSLVKLCTIPSANTPVLIPLSNLPVWPSGNFSSLSGVVGYIINICLAAGTTFTAPANDIWQNGNFLGAVGQDNFASNTLGSTFDIAFVQHEPGSLCTTLIDKPWFRNYEECLRYFCKSYDYNVALGANSPNGQCVGWNSQAALTGADFQCGVRFPKPMAVTPGTTPVFNGAGLYTWTGAGTANAVRDGVGAADRGVSAFLTPGMTGFRGITLGASLVANSYGLFHYKMDTGW